MSGSSMRESRETPQVSGGKMPDRLEKAMSHESGMNACGEPDERVVPAKLTEVRHYFDSFRLF
jgi:hypothetical protein